MSSERSKTGWSAPRTGGYSARVPSKSVLTGRSSGAGTSVTAKYTKPSPPKGRAAASKPTKSGDGQ